jgi:hypothetical protein
MTDHDTPTPWPDNPWVLYTVDGHAAPSEIVSAADMRLSNETVSWYPFPEPG